MRRHIVPAISVMTAVTLLAACGGAGGPSGGGGKISDDKIVLGVLNDQSGVYADLSGPNAVEAVKMAVDDFKAKHGDNAVSKNIEVVIADHQNKPDDRQHQGAGDVRPAEGRHHPRRADLVGGARGRRPGGGEEEALLQHHRGDHRADRAKCNKYTFHYAYDTYMLANGTGTTVTKAGAKNWYIVYPDYAFGQDMEKSFTTAVEEAGGKVVGKKSSEFPNTSGDFSSYLLKAPTLAEAGRARHHAGRR